jgi:programmed cell death protein 5
MEEEDEELQALRAKRLQDAQLQQDQAKAFEEQKKAMDEQKKAVLRQILTPDARERLANVKLARPDMAEEIEKQLIMLASSGRLGRKVTDEDLKLILSKMMPKKREIKIRTKR